MTSRRDEYIEALRDYIPAQFRDARKAQGFTQAQAAEILAMDPRSYSNIETGNHSCGALTLLRFLLYICPDQQAFLDGARAQLEAGQDGA